MPAVRYFRNEVTDWHKHDFYRHEISTPLSVRAGTRMAGKSPPVKVWLVLVIDPSIFVLRLEGSFATARVPR